MITRIQSRRGTAAQWTASNPRLANGELGFESDTGKFKFGDGVSTWSTLEYFAPAEPPVEYSVEVTSPLTNSGTEINAVIGLDDTNYAKLTGADFSGTVEASTLNSFGGTIKDTLLENGTFSYPKEAVKITQFTNTTRQVDLSQGSVWWFTNDNTENYNINISAGASSLNSIMSVGQAMTLAVIATNGAVPYSLGLVQIDGVTVSPLWQSALLPISENDEGNDVYTFSIIKTAANEFTVLAAYTIFKAV